MVAAIEQGFPQRAIHEASLVYQRAIESGERKVVGVNVHTQEESRPVATLRISPEVEEIKVRRLRRLKARRNAGRLRRALDTLAAGARRGEHLMPLVIDAVRSQATVGEVSDLFRAVFGEHREAVEF
jgi:methylmalonyl-CoA mutase N-terminal domain/subunit